MVLFSVASINKNLQPSHIDEILHLPSPRSVQNIQNFYQILWIIVTKYKENNDIAQAPHPKSPVSDAHSIGGGTCRQVLYQLVFTEYTECLIKKPCTAIGKKEGIIFTSFCFQSCLSHLLKNILNPAVSSLPSMKLHHFHPHLNKPQISCVHMS